MTKPSRRQFIITGIGALAAGCSQSGRLAAGRPGPMWPRSQGSPQVDGQAYTLPQRPEPIIVPKQIGPIDAIPRSRWAKSNPINTRLRSMGSIQRITVHHEGWTPVWFSDIANTSQRLESIRRSHLKRLKAGDIGYHFVIDRSGRVWQGRDLMYQGAHVRDHNPHNIGVMVLGNFDLQRPTEQQANSLCNVLSNLRHQHGVPVNRIYTHQELNVTSCPGKALQSQTVALRHSGRLT